MKITATAPTRIDLAGGTLDLEPLYLFHERAASVNMAITVAVSVIVNSHKSPQVTIISKDQKQKIKTSSLKKLNSKKLPLITETIKHFAPVSGFTITTDSAVPEGSGLGGSSSLMVAAVAALKRMVKQNNHNAILTTAKAIETSVIKVPTGYQDYLAAIHGGINVWHFNTAGIKQEPLKLSKNFIKELEEHLILVYTGVPHFSGQNNWEIFKRHVNGNRRMYKLFEELRDNAIVMTNALKSQNLNALASALNRDWSTRKKLAPTVTTHKIENLIKHGKKIGIIGARVCGAGGGGCMVVVAKREKATEVKQWLKKQQVKIIPYQIDWRGVVVIGG